MRFRVSIITLLAFVATVATARQADAQGGLVLGAGLGSVLNERHELPTSLDDVSHKLAFASLREVSYDYSGLRISHWLGRTVEEHDNWAGLIGAAPEFEFVRGDPRFVALLERVRGATRPAR